jgi:hypothetical protein
MKTFKEYLAESKKVYSFKVKVAGELPENFQEGLKTRLGRCGVMTFEKQGTTPVQALPIDFPQLKNCEVHIFEVICEYPVISSEIANEVHMMGLQMTHVKVKNSADPTEEEQALIGNLLSDSALLDDPNYKEAGKVKVKEYFGPDFNKGFLKDLEKVSKQKQKEGGPTYFKDPLTGKPMSKTSEKDAGLDFGNGANSPVGSHQNKIPDPYKG